MLDDLSPAALQAFILLGIFGIILIVAVVFLVVSFVTHHRYYNTAAPVITEDGEIKNPPKEKLLDRLGVSALLKRNRKDEDTEDEEEEAEEFFSLEDYAAEYTPEEMIDGANQSTVEMLNAVRSLQNKESRRRSRSVKNIFGSSKSK